MYKKYHEKFKILYILAVTTQAREGIETLCRRLEESRRRVTTQAREGIETYLAVCPLNRFLKKSACPRQNLSQVALDWNWSILKSSMKKEKPC